jgi:uncharacterized protein YoxC
MADLHTPCLGKPAHTLKSADSGTCESSSEVTADAIIDGIKKLTPELRNKVLSKAWTDVTAVVNECNQAFGALKSCSEAGTESNQDWSKLNRAVNKLSVDEQKEKAITAFYEAVITVLQERKERQFSV